MKTYVYAQGAADRLVAEGWEVKKVEDLGDDRKRWTMFKVYQRKTSYLFECAGCLFEATSWSENHVSFEDTRKNGQEDTHAYGEVFRRADGTWWWGKDPEWPEEGPPENLASECNTDKVLDFFNKNGAPPRG